jgi:hypothetical protein
VPPGIKVCSAQQRRRTPVAFAEWLVSVASRCAVYHELDPLGLREQIRAAAAVLQSGTEDS